MKIFYTVLFLFIGIFLLLKCTPKVVYYDHSLSEIMQPVPWEFSSVDSLNLVNKWVLGSKIFKKECSRCHGIYTAGKKDITNYSVKDYDNYHKEFLLKNPKNHAVIQNLTEEEMDAITNFLTGINKIR